MADEIHENEQEEPQPEPTPEPEQPAEEPATVAAVADGWQSELVLESQRYVMKVTAPDGSVHIVRSQEDLDALKTTHDK